MPCVCTVDTVEKFCGGVNAPKLQRELHITCEDEILLIPPVTADTLKVETDISMRAADAGPPVVEDGLFYNWGFSSKEDSSFEAERDDNGMVQTAVSIFIERINAEKSYILNGMTADNQIALVEDKNGEVRIVGELGNGCTVRTKEVTTPRNGYEISINWESRDVPKFYTGAIVT